MTADRAPDRVPPQEILSAAEEGDIARVERLARLMDTSIRLPVVGVRVGLDGLIGLIPGVGDAATVLPAAYIIYMAYRLGVPNQVLARMILNSGADVALGTVPLIGDIFDFAFKSNRRNVALLRRHVEARRVVQTPRKSG